MGDPVAVDRRVRAVRGDGVVSANRMAADMLAEHLAIERREQDAQQLAPSTRTVHTPGTLTRVPNQPKTPIRAVRVSDELWQAAQAKAAERGEDVSTVIRAALERYVKRKDRT